MRHYIFTFILFFATVAAFSQGISVKSDEQLAYAKTIHQRAEKIVSALAIADSSKANRVTDIVAGQYLSLSDIQNTKDTKIKAAKAQVSDNKESITTQVKAAEDMANQQIQDLHPVFITSLKKELNSSQVDLVKDGMTYSVVPITYKGYLGMIPNLTEAQKKQIMTWLIEAREHAMDAESSQKKHAWFGKYKGRINNYLSAEGYDLKKLGEEWQKRTKAASTEK